MSFYYVPQKLESAREKIVEKHSLGGQDRPPFSDEELTILIGRIAMLEPEKVKGFALSLTEKEMKMIATYIPRNQYGVDLTNLFEIYRLRSNPNLHTILYQSWQNSYNKRDCNEFLSDLCDKDKLFETMIISYYDSVTGFRDALYADYVPMFFAKVIQVNKSISTLEDLAKTFGIVDKSLLYKEISNVFYVFCDRDTYLKLGDEELLKIVQKYASIKGRNLQKELLANLLNQLSFSDLEKFRKLALYFKRVIGETNSDKYVEFFTDVNDKLVKKYLDWINIIDLIEVFGSDERSEFWKKYRFLNVKKFVKSQVVLMETEDYYISEFLGDGGMGAAYFIKRDFFKEKKLIFGFRNNNKQDLVSDLFFLFNKYGNPDVIRLRHLSSWKYRFDEVIAEYNITSRIY